MDLIPPNLERLEFDHANNSNLADECHHDSLPSVSIAASQIATVKDCVRRN